MKRMPVMNFVTSEMAAWRDYAALKRIINKALLAALAVSALVFLIMAGYYFANAAFWNASDNDALKAKIAAADAEYQKINASVDTIKKIDDNNKHLIKHLIDLALVKPAEVKFSSVSLDASTKMIELDCFSPQITAFDEYANKINARSDSFANATIAEITANGANTMCKMRIEIR